MDELIKKAVSPIILLSGSDLFDLDMIYIAGEKRILCDVTKDDKLLDALILLMSSYFVYNFDYSLLRNVMIFLEHTMLDIDVSKMPVRVTEVFRALQQQD